MSMKRTKQRSAGGRSGQEEGSFGILGAPPKMPEWKELVEGVAESDFLQYSPASTFQRGDKILHSKFGRGIVTLVEGSRFEILFEDGAKKLVHTAPA